MIISRSSIFVRLPVLARRGLLQNKLHKSFENLRKSHSGSWSYRKVPPPDPKTVKLLETFGAVAWWWLIWHLVTDYEELLPHPFPDPSKWTDEELGIPPIEE